MMIMMTLGGLLFSNFFGIMSVMVSMFIFFFLMIMNLGDYSFMSVGILMNNLNLILVILTIWIYMIIYMMSGIWGNLMWKSLLLILSLFLIFCFIMSSFFIFFVFFELVLIPMFLLILLYGNYTERLESSFFLLFYTMLGSLPLLMMIMGGLSKYNWSISYMVLMKSEMEISSVGSMMMISAFLMKMPMYGVHIWLPKAHVEAPLVGSSILAGILLKLGGYGMMLVMPFLSMNLKLKVLIMMVGLIGGINCSLACMRQNDIKKLVAYSSVVHMGIMLSGSLTYMEEGWSGAIMMMVCHGLCSSGLFYFVNMIYERTFTRSIMLVKGCGMNLSGLMLWFFFLVIVNMGCPPFLSMFSESMLVMSLLKWEFLFVISLMLMFFLTVAYNIYFYSMIVHGLSNLLVFKLISVQEYLVLFIHFCPSIMLIFLMDLFIYI